MLEHIYEISAVEAFNLYKDNEAFQKVLSSGNFIYCEKKFVLNHPNYISFDEHRIAHLTDYAKMHNEECCLVFTLISEIIDNNKNI